jgi:arsenate reductase
MSNESSLPTVLFLCVHNAGRSQMAAGFARTLGAGLINVRSAGSAPGESLNAAVVTAMAERGIDISNESPRALSESDALAATVVVTMGCGDACPFYPGKRYEEWELQDPAGQSVEFVRRVRDNIERRVRALIIELTSD